MDLKADQHRQLTQFIDDWFTDSDLELESTFGERGVVESNTFLQIAQRIRSKDFEMIPQEDHLSILTPKNLRFSLHGLGVIQSYCREDTLPNQSYTILRKERNSPDSNLDWKEYDIRIKMRRETNLDPQDPEVAALVASWATQKKAFRLIRRWSFKGKGIRIDLSMVRQTPIDPETRQFQWSTHFLKKNILLEVPRYEVEVELLHDQPETSTPARALHALISGMGEVERAIQRNTLLIKKSVVASVRAEYQALVESKEFRGVNPVTLQLENMGEAAVDPEDMIPNVRRGYNVTDKADGLRAMGFVDATGELFLLDQSMNVYRTGLRNPSCARSLVDGEWVTMTVEKKPIHHYLIFDIYHDTDGKKVSSLPFAQFKEKSMDMEADTRFQRMNEWYKRWTTGMQIITKHITEATRLIVALKRFEFASAYTPSIFTHACASILDGSHLYHTDGLILTSLSKPLPDGAGVRFSHQFKWKPAIDNTIDFLVKYDRHPELPMDTISTTISSTDDRVIQYKTLHLFVGGISRPPPRDVILNQLPSVKEGGQRYQAILFAPLDYPDTMANQCYVPIEVDAETNEAYCITADSNEPIPDCSIVEMRYDPTKEPGWRWIPSRIRHDKTERLIKEKERSRQTGRPVSYSRMMNDEKVAQSVWNSIHEPITVSMIRSGRMEPNEDEMKALMESRKGDMTRSYYQRTAPKENTAMVRGLRDFHNEYIKDMILLQTGLRKGTRLVDVACGKGGDLWKWTKHGARYVVGIDYAGENITNPNDGAYARYVDMIPKARGAAPQIAFLVGNSSKPIVTGEAGASPQEKDMFRSIFGRENPEGPLPKFIQHTMAGQFREGADVVACMFALHYFFENQATLDGFLENLSQLVKSGGYMIGCCFDGKKVFRLLQNLNKGQSKEGMEDGVPIWSITKEYDEDDWTDDEMSVGRAIDVEFISIGSTHREYLVSFDYFTKRMNALGFQLLDAAACAENRLAHSTETFDVTYAAAMRQKKTYRMSDSIKEFSFLNRWFIFQRVHETVIPPIELAEEKEVQQQDEQQQEQEQEQQEQEQQEQEQQEQQQEKQMKQEKQESNPSPPVGPAFRLPPPDKKFELSEVFPFGVGTPRRDLRTLLKLRPADQPEVTSDPIAGRWLSLAAPFPIPDPLPSREVSEEDVVWYPTMEHYLAAMKLKHALVLPRHQDGASLAVTVMSMPNGSIHQKAMRERAEQVGLVKESDNDTKLWAKEAKAVRDYMARPSNVLRLQGHFDEARWSTLRGDFLRNALRYRFQKDTRFHNIIMAVKPRYLLYVKDARNTNLTESEQGVPSSELYGKRDASRGVIVGRNEVGKAIMEIAGFVF